MNKGRNGSLSKLLDAAFERAAVRVIQRAKQTGTPVILWEEGVVKVVSHQALESATMGKKNRARRRSSS
jgi:hypothetical protein